jgi:hypothetical protein
MTIKKFMQKRMLILLLLCLGTSYAWANGFMGQNLQINTHFRNILGKPTWLLILRDIDNNQVLPYIYDIEEKNNFWIAFTYGHTYQVTASTIRFLSGAEFANFCNLEHNIFHDQSMFVTVSGDLTWNRQKSVCRVRKFKSSGF